MSDLHHSNSLSPIKFDNVSDIFCGCIAGAIGKVIQYPFDTVKVRLQTQPDNLAIRFNGPIQCLKYSVQHGGVQSLYHGIAYPVMGSAVENATLFLVYNTGQRVLKNYWYSNQEYQNKRLPLPALIACGSFSGVVTSFLLTPIELVKCRMQTQELYASTNTASRSVFTKTQSPIDIILQVYRKQGLLSFWHGQMGTLLREAGGSAAWFGTYEFVKARMRQFHNRDTNTLLESMLAGACAGVMYYASLFPADTIKSRMQTEELINVLTDNGKTKEPPIQQTFWTVAKKIYKTGGIKGFYRGFSAIVTCAAPANAVIFASYETLKSQLHDHF